MNHLWIGYDALLVAMSVVNLLLLFLARNRKPFLLSFMGFYAAFALGLFVALSRRYVVFNVEGSHGTFAFLAYGLGTVLSYVALACVVPCYYRMLGWPHLKRAHILAAALGVAGVFAITPWSVEFAQDGQSYALNRGHYAASVAYFAMFTYVMYLAVLAARGTAGARDRVFARVLLVFATVGYVESTVSVFAEIGDQSESLGEQGEYFLFSSIPYALFSAFLVTYLLPLIGAGSAGGTANRARVEALELSEREQEVLGLLLQGLSNKRIANELHISEATVKTHLNKIFRKANVRSRFELARELSAPSDVA
jgi:DNA-binding CsgD family transcriptional regulator